MAHEVVIKTKTDLPINMAAQNESAIEKGHILQLIDERTVSGTQVSGMPIAGICAREKILNDGRPVAVYRRGIFDMVVSGAAVAVGDDIQMANPAQGDNTCQTPSPALSLGEHGKRLGTSLGVLANDTSETIQVSVNL